MDKINTQVMPVPPNLLASFKSGFDAIANQIVVILIPVAFDLLLWLGPHLQVKTLILNLYNSLSSSTGLNYVQPNGLFGANEEMIRAVASQYNLLSILRTIPVGIPSIMSGRLPLEIPNGLPLFVDIINPIILLVIVVSLVFVGILVGSFYYLSVFNVSITGKLSWNEVFRNLPRSFIQVISLTVALLILFVAISVPAFCAILGVALIGLPLGQFAMFLYIGVLLWLAFPLLFSAHGIFVNHNNALISVQKSMLLTRMTLPTTTVFVLIVLAISEGLDVLWRVPPESSWLTLIGVGGHAFVTSALLASSFVYYRDADRWIQVTMKTLKSQIQTPLNSP